MPDLTCGRPYVAKRVPISRPSKQLHERIIAAVHDDEVPMSSVENDLHDAEVRVVCYDPVRKVVTAELRVCWTATLAIDYEGDMTESGLVIGTADFKHRGRSLELLGERIEVVYDTLLSGDEPI